MRARSARERETCARSAHRKKARACSARRRRRRPPTRTQTVLVFSLLRFPGIMDYQGNKVLQKQCLQLPRRAQRASEVRSTRSVRGPARAAAEQHRAQRGHTLPGFAERLFIPGSVEHLGYSRIPRVLPLWSKGGATPAAAGVCACAQRTCCVRAAHARPHGRKKAVRARRAHRKNSFFRFAVFPHFIGERNCSKNSVYSRFSTARAACADLRVLLRSSTARSAATHYRVLRSVSLFPVVWNTPRVLQNLCVCLSVCPS